MLNGRPRTIAVTLSAAKNSSKSLASLVNFVRLMVRAGVGNLLQDITDGDADGLGAEIETGQPAAGLDMWAQGFNRIENRVWRHVGFLGPGRAGRKPLIGGTKHSTMASQSKGGRYADYMVWTFGVSG